MYAAYLGYTSKSGMLANSADKEIYWTPGRERMTDVQFSSVNNFQLPSIAFSLSLTQKGV